MRLTEHAAGTPLSSGSPECTVVGNVATCRQPCRLGTSRRDVAVVDRRDRVRGCEQIARTRAPAKR